MQLDKYHFHSPLYQLPLPLHVELQLSSMTLPPLLPWLRPPDMTITAKNEPSKILVVWEEVSCSRLNGRGGLRALAVDDQMFGKEKEVFSRKIRYSEDNGTRMYLFLF